MIPNIQSTLIRRWFLYGMALLVHTLPQARAAEPDAKVNSDSLLFACNFESPTWYEQWGRNNPPRNTSTLISDPERRFDPLEGKALRIRVEEDGHYGTSLQFKFQEQLGFEPDAVYFRYYLRFADDWDPERGGKLPGIAGTYGRAGWGGRPADGQNGWSARGLFDGRENGRTPIGFYCYHADMQSRYGSHWVWDKDKLGYLANNRWYCVEQYARLNTPGQNDGVLRGWIDGKLAFEKTDVRMRDVDSLNIETVWINLYHGGRWTAQSPDHLYIDNVAIGTEPIGP